MGNNFDSVDSISSSKLRQLRFNSQSCKCLDSCEIPLKFCIFLGFFMKSSSNIFQISKIGSLLGQVENSFKIPEKKVSSQSAKVLRFHSFFFIRQSLCCLKEQLSPTLKIWFRIP